MKKTHIFLLPLLLLGSNFLRAQSAPAPVPVTQITIGQSTVQLTGPWKFHIGDNMTWAQPGFDDSGWGTMDLTPPRSAGPELDAIGGEVLPGWTARGYPGYSGYAWYRLRVNVQEAAQATNTALALKMPGLFDDAYQVYVNGQLVGEFGRFTKHGVTYYGSQPRAFSLPAHVLSANGSGPLTIAIRMWMHPSTLQPRGAGGMHGPPVLGKASVIGASLDLDGYTLDRRRASDFLEAAILLLAMLAAFGLYWLDRSEPAYLWLGLACVDSATFNLFVLAQFWIRPASFLYLTLLLTLGVVIGFWVIFWGYWFRLGNMARLHRMVWGLVLLFLVVAVMRRALFANHIIPAQAAAWLSPLSVILNILNMLLVVLLLWVAYRGIRKDRTEGWLALPAVVLLAISRFQGTELIRKWINLHPYGISVHLDQVAYVLALAIVTVLLLRRFLQGQQERARIRTELQQARSVQEMLIPQHSVQVPGFAVESVYIPASEVGGDFFQVQPGDDGSVLIVVGDVSGKGLKAAMTVSAIVGALRDRKERQPAEVLAHLNRVLHGQVSGFVTCCATLITSDGAMTLANAGHLSPYRNGEEMAVAGGLPLGILAEGSYEETQYQLASGDRLTFMSDGVVEATNEKRELFGFERTQQISNQAAAAIAETAKAFGQQDDITVVTIERRAIPAYALV